MTTSLERFTAPSKASKGTAVFNLVRMPVITAIQVLAALALDGWLSVALWINATYNAVLFSVAVVNFAFIAVEVHNKETES